MTSTPTKPLTDQQMWRKLIARAHPDTGGDHELFVWASSLREHVSGDAIEQPKHVPPRTTHANTRASGESERISYDQQFGYVDEFCTLTMRALSVGQHVEEPYRSILGLLIDCPGFDHGCRVARQCRGASYRQLARIGYLLGWSKGERARFYQLCRAIPLSDAHASHILGQLGCGERRSA